MLQGIGQAQTKADYIKAITKFQTYYNRQQCNEITNMFSDTWGAMKQTLWEESKQKHLWTDYGKMISFQYLMEEDSLAYFKTEFEKSVHMMSLSLDKANKFETFRFQTSDTHIDSVLGKRAVKVIKRK